MSLSDRIYTTNRWFDHLPQQTQFLLAFWTAMALLVTLLIPAFFLGWPFDFLVLLTVLVIMGPRVAFKFGMIGHSASIPPAPVGETRVSLTAHARVFQANRWFDALPDLQRGAAVMAGIIGTLIVNLALYALIGLPVGLLLMLGLLVVGIGRVGYVNGWLVPAAAASGGDPALPAPSPVAMGPAMAATAASETRA